MLKKMLTKINDKMFFRISNGVREYPSRPLFDIEDIFPIFKDVTFQWERNFTPFGFIHLVHTKYYIAPLIVILYLLICKNGPKLLQNRKPYNLRKTVIIWNILLSIFNLIVTLKILPVVLCVIYKYTLTGLLIIPPIYLYAFNSVGLWLCLFIISKYVELIDTLFLILRKKNISLLHWFHHSTVLLYTWDTYFSEVPAGIIFICVNAIVHTVMYAYYALATYCSRPLKWSVCVTIIQILQMILGIAITIYCLFITYNYRYNDKWTASFVETLGNKFTFDYGHYISRKNIIYACLIYLSYFYLFTKYFIDRYFSKKALSKKVLAKKKV